MRGENGLVIIQGIRRTIGEQGASSTAKSPARLTGGHYRSRTFPMLPAGEPGPLSRILESPFVLRRGALFYLFVGFSHRPYHETFVVVAGNPHRFSPQNKLTTLFTHAAELIELDGKTYMTSCGIEDPQALGRSGLWMSQLAWLKP